MFENMDFGQLGSQLGSVFTLTGRSGSGGGQTPPPLTGFGFGGGGAVAPPVGGSGGSGLGGVLGSLGSMFGGGSGGFGNAFSGAASGATAGLAFGPVGAAAGAALGFLASFAGGNPRVPFGAEANSRAPHKVGVGAGLDMSNWNQENGNEYARHAITNGCTVEDIEDMNFADRARSGNSWEQVVAWWRTHPGQLTAELTAAGRVNTFRAPGGSAGPAAAFPGSQSFGGLGFAPGGAGALNFGGGGAAPAPGLKDYATGAYQGALTGLGNVFGKTREGQQLQNDGAKQWLESNWYIPSTLALVVGSLAVLAFKKK